MLPQTADNEQYLLEQIAEGNEEAFEQLFTPMATRLENLLRRYVTSAQDRQDIMQNTLLKCWLNRDRLPGVQHLGAYVRQIAVNEFHQHLRTEIAERRRRDGARENNALIEVNDDRQRLEMKECIASAIERLSPQRQKIYRLSREQGLTIPQIAEHLGLSASTVKLTLMAALEGIRAHLRTDGYGFLLLLFLHQ